MRTLAQVRVCMHTRHTICVSNMVRQCHLKTGKSKNRTQNKTLIPPPKKIPEKMPLPLKLRWHALQSSNIAGYDILKPNDSTWSSRQCDIPPSWPIRVLVVRGVVVDMAKTRRGAVEVPSSASSSGRKTLVSTQEALRMNPLVSWCTKLRFASVDSSTPKHLLVYIGKKKLVDELFKWKLGL